MTAAILLQCNAISASCSSEGNLGQLTNRNARGIRGPIHGERERMGRGFIGVNCQNYFKGFSLVFILYTIEFQYF